jgi:hypothetical protein
LVTTEFWAHRSVITSAATGTGKDRDNSMHTLTIIRFYAEQIIKHGYTRAQGYMDDTKTRKQPRFAPEHLKSPTKETRGEK